jgi:hypothetical protein
MISATGRRYRRLTETGTVKIVAFSDLAAMAKDRLFLLFMKVGPEHHDEVAKALASKAASATSAARLSTVV